MKTKSGKIIYSLNIDDLQMVSDEVLGRALTDSECALIQQSVGDYIDWFEAIEHAIREKVDDVQS